MQPPHVYIEPPVKGVAVLDFMKVRSILLRTEGTVEIAKRAVDAALAGNFSEANHV